jgi:hypothetical protein
MIWCKSRLSRRKAAGRLPPQLDFTKSKSSKSVRFPQTFLARAREFFRARRLAGHALWRKTQRARGKSASQFQ